MYTVRQCCILTYGPWMEPPSDWELGDWSNLGTWEQVMLSWGPRCQVGTTKHTGGVWKLRQKAGPLKSDWMGQEDCSGHQLCQWLISGFHVLQNSEKEVEWIFKKKFKKKILRCILITKKERWKPKGENLLFHSNVGGSGKHYSHWNKLNAGKDEKNLWFHSCGI